ncbi:MAG: sensor histidine kinase [Legionellales bacterium]|nr:sensor histidine kinase [Legionellales bacterium]
MTSKPFTLASQIKKEIGNRIFLCSIALFLIVFGLAFYDISTEIDQLPLRINPEIKPLETFSTNQILIDNARTIQLKLNDFNANNNAFNVKWIPHITAKSNQVHWHFPLLWSYNYPLGKIAGFQLGYFKISGSIVNDPVLMNEFLIRFGLLLFFSIALFTLLLPLAKKIPDKLFIAPINRFLDLIADNPAANEHDLSPPIELRELETKILTLISNTKEYERSQALIQLGNSVAQVVHDIRSPLSALNALIKRADNLPEQQRVTMRNVSQRINDIANNLLAQYRNPNRADEHILKPELVSILLDRMISEKRAQYHEKPIEFQLTITDAAHSAFAMIEAQRLKSALSNLIDNAIEALPEQGNIHLRLEIAESDLAITISDNGCGIPLELQADILAGGVSIGKKEGNGIGLSSSRRLIESWNGRFELESIPDHGTHIRILLPETDAANWFLSKLLLLPSQTIVILDDDPLIHDIWKKRFSDETLASENIHFLQFTDANTLSATFPTLPENTLFLVDYELPQYAGNGLNLIHTLDIASRSILVTNHDDVLDLRDRCLKSGIPILPKVFATHIPISVLSQQPEIIFIDDNPTITESWRFMAELAGKKILTFNDIHSARKVILSLPKKTLIYVDADLTNHERGEDFAKELFELGYHELYLATGHEMEKFAHCYWLKEVIGKDPPFNV